MSSRLRGTALVVDDDLALGTVLASQLKQAGIDARHVSSVEAALKAVAASPFDAVLTDLRMPGRDGLSLLREMKQIAPDVPIVMLTAHGTIPVAVEAMKAGAADFLTKPYDQNDMVLTMRKVLAAAIRAEDRPPPLRDAAASLFGSSEAMRDVVARVKKVAAVTSNVLVQGESGTGKELVARAIHDLSARQKGPFVAVNCAALPDDLLESEMFGHERGAHSTAFARKPGRVEIAQGGTLFLDEIGEVSRPLQPKLLRLLQEKEYQPLGGTRTERADVRFVAATHRDLVAMVNAGTLREDFYYRLWVANIELPPLRARREDILGLATRFCDALARENGRPRMRFADGALQRLTEYDWPGNVRELQNTVERLVVFADGDVVDESDVQRELEGPRPRSRAPSGDPAPATLDEIEPSTLAARRGEAERDAVIDALRRTGDNRTKAAQLLRISRRTLYKRLAEFGLS